MCLCVASLKQTFNSIPESFIGCAACMAAFMTLGGSLLAGQARQVAKISRSPAQLTICLEMCQ